MFSFALCLGVSPVCVRTLDLDLVMRIESMFWERSEPVLLLRLRWSAEEKLAR